ncbi:MAG: FHA domain-containing protein, partial [Candidatus Rokuibacteriota bacterium]
MPLEIRILSGARAGQTARFEQSTIVVGRIDGSDLKFDPQHDLDVSSKHAEFRMVGSGYEVHDNNSTNGTLVNGAKITGGVKLKSGDRVKFGREGPEVEVAFR